jgi:hypothetical protein
MNARTSGVESLKINFAIADIFHAKLGKLEVRKPLALLCDGDDYCDRHIQGSIVLLCDVDRLRHRRHRLL